MRKFAQTNLETGLFSGNPREDELINVLAGLLKKIENEGKEFVTGTSNAGTSFDILLNEACSSTTSLYYSTIRLSSPRNRQ
jgi:hypothetical protein